MRFGEILYSVITLGLAVFLWYYCPFVLIAFLAIITFYILFFTF